MRLCMGGGEWLHSAEAGIVPRYAVHVPATHWYQASTRISGRALPESLTR